MVALLAIGTTDVLFASTRSRRSSASPRTPYIVFTANAFALMGLRQLYFLIGGLLKRLVHLGLRPGGDPRLHRRQAGLHALHTNELPFVNGGQPVELVPEVPTWLSLVVIAGTLAVTTVTSLRATSRRAVAAGAS